MGDGSDEEMQSNVSDRVLLGDIEEEEDDDDDENMDEGIEGEGGKRAASGARKRQQGLQRKQQDEEALPKLQGDQAILKKAQSVENGWKAHQKLLETFQSVEDKLSGRMLKHALSIKKNLGRLRNTLRQMERGSDEDLLKTADDAEQGIYVGPDTAEILRAAQERREQREQFEAEKRKKYQEDKEKREAKLKAKLEAEQKVTEAEQKVTDKKKELGTLRRKATKMKKKVDDFPAGLAPRVDVRNASIAEKDVQKGERQLAELERELKDLKSKKKPSVAKKPVEAKDDDGDDDNDDGDDDDGDDEDDADDADAGNGENVEEVAIDEDEDVVIDADAVNSDDGKPPKKKPKDDYVGWREKIGAQIMTAIGEHFEANVVRAMSASVKLESFSSDRSGWNAYFSGLVDFVHRCVKGGGGDLISVIREIKNEMDPGLKFLD